MDDYNIYDKINTTAANWLRIYAKNTQQLLGIKKFSGKNKIHIWLLKMIEIASLANGYQDYWVECSWFDWIKFKFFKHFTHMKKYSKKNNKKSNIIFIDIPIFVDEICEACGRTYKDIEQMFDNYWRI